MGDETPALDEHEDPCDWTSEEQKAFRRAFNEQRRRQRRVGQVFTGVLLALVSLGVLATKPAARFLNWPLVLYPG